MRIRSTRHGRPRSPFRFVIGDDLESTIPLSRGLLTIGRSRACDIVIPAASVMPRHAELSVTESGVIIERAEPSAEMLVNRIPVQRASLSSSDEVVLGDVRLRLERNTELARRERRPSSPVTLPGPVDWVEVLESLHDWSRGGALDKRGAMLGVLVDAFALRGAALVQRRSGNGLVAVNAWGEVAELLRDPLIERALREAVSSGATAAHAARDIGVVAIGHSDSDAVALVVRGGASLAHALPPLRLALRFLAHEYYSDQFRESLAAAGGGVLAFPRDTVVGRSPAIVRVYEELRAIADHPMPVLLVGETGTGKGELARLLHGSSPRHQMPLVVIDCASPEELLERRMTALLEPARTRAARAEAIGTVLLDEVGALSLPRQATLVGLLEALGRNGGGQGSTLTPRVLATMGQEPEEWIAQGRIRRDLYHRLAGFVLRVPPLRERREDIPLLFDHFLVAELGPRRPALSAEALAALLGHRWEGNLRELRFEASRVAVRARGDTIGLAELSPALRLPRDIVRPSDPSDDSLDLAERFRDVERELIERALRRSANRVGRAAELLGISRTRLRRRLRSLGIAAAAADPDDAA